MKTNSKKTIFTAINTRHGISLLTLAILTLLAVGSADSEEQTRQIKSAPPESSVTAPQLYAEYEANEVAADTRYKGKIVVVNGVVEDIGKDLLDDAYVLLASGNMMFGVQCFFDKSEEHSFGNLSRGQQVSVKGRVDGKLGNVFLRDCSFQ